MTTPRDQDTLEVKGGSIRSKRDFVRVRFGDDAEAALDRYLEDRGHRHILEANWYPFEVFDGVLRYIADNHYGGDLGRLREVGRFSAEAALTGTYDFLMRQRDFSRFMDRISVLHERYYSRGKLIVGLMADAPRHCDMMLEGAPFYTEPDLQVAAGFFTGAAEMMGLANPRCRFEQRTGRVLFRLDWD